MTPGSLRERARALKQNVTALWLACRHPRTPLPLKLLGLLIAGYALSPIDLIPDFIPVLGYLDDIILLPLGIWLFIRLVPDDVWQECKKKAGDIRPGRSRIAAMVIVSIWVLALAGTILILLPSCTAIQKRADISGIKDLVKEMRMGFKPGDPADLKTFLDTCSLADQTAPRTDVTIISRPRARRFWELEYNAPLTQEELVFPSRIVHPVRPDTARFYVYRKGDWQNSKTILWVPGLGVSDLAFRFIKKFFTRGLDQGYNIVVYVLPFHLERAKRDVDNGEGFLTADVRRNVTMFLEAVRELRTMTVWLRGQGAASVGVWAGSIGATMALLADQTEKYDHMALMIPVLDMETTFIKNPRMAPLMKLYKKQGFDEKLLCRAYCLLSPERYALHTPPHRTFIMAAEYDQLTPPAIIKDYAGKNGITQLTFYERSHASILVTKQLYRDYTAFLESLDQP